MHINYKSKKRKKFEVLAFSFQENIKNPSFNT